nr:hypothetical protein [Candidatus Sigynarchaeum springense]
MTGFFPAAESLIRSCQSSESSFPELATLLEKFLQQEIEAQLAALRDSATYAGQDEWDSLFEFPC